MRVSSNQNLPLLVGVKWYNHFEKVAVSNNHTFNPMTQKFLSQVFTQSK